MNPPLQDRFRGCLLGLAVGDALGGRFEAQNASHIRSRFANASQLMASVPTAIASFALTPHSFLETIGNVIFLGGDTDTMAAMAGALSGAYLGMSGIPPSLVDHLESSPKGRAYILALADRLYAAHLA